MTRKIKITLTADVLTTPFDPQHDLKQIAGFQELTLEEQAQVLAFDREFHNAEQRSEIAEATRRNDGDVDIALDLIKLLQDTHRGY